MEIIDSKDLIKKFHKYFDEYKRKDIKKIVNEGHSFMPISFFEISEYDFELGDTILANPIECIAIMEETLKQFAELDEDAKTIKIRFTNLPLTEKIMIRDIRSEHLGKLIMLEGLVRRKTDVRPRLKYLEYLCTNPSCNYSQDKIRVPQFEDKARVLKNCPKCKSGVEVLNKILLDSQNLVLEEIPEQLSNSGDQPKRMNVLLQEDLVSPFKDSRTNPGSRVYVIGMVKEIPISTKSGAESINYELIVEGNYIDMTEDDYSEIKISKEEEEQIKELAKKEDVLEILVKNTAPAIYGYTKIKEAILLQLFGGAGADKGGGIRTRGDIHILLLGDPGAAKSQLLKSASKVAPKSMFVSGKSASGVGLTASIVKDEMTGGWGLEAGAIVLASGGLCAIDEMDKMSDDDTSAMHEALEQQCYHYDFELQFADGSSQKIGQYVENLFDKNKNKIIQGINCEILDIKTKELFTTDFNKISKIVPQRISRHIAPKKYYKINYSNGRSITVTPEHPVFVYLGDGVKEISAVLVKKDMIVPVPRIVEFKGSKQELIVDFNKSKRNKEILLPGKLNLNIAKLLGYLSSEGHSYFSEKNRYAEIGISNTDSVFIDNCSKIFKSEFGIDANINVQKSENRKKATKDLITVRSSSKTLYKFFELNFPEILVKAPIKRVPNIIKMSLENERKAFLSSFFSGDGFVDNYRCGFCSASIKMVEDLQDLLLNFGIYSVISKNEVKGSVYYKVIITGTENLVKFSQIVDNNDKRFSKILSLIEKSKIRPNARDTIPYEFLVGFNDFLKKLHISDGTFTTLIKRKQNSHRDVVNRYLEKAKLKLESLKSLKDNNYDYLFNRYIDFEKFINSEMRYIRVLNVEEVVDKKYNWVYDVTVPPNKTFISQGLVLHNTISIAKANIRATLKCPTTVLAAANPKFGRFDPYGDVMKQIDFPPALVSRFDLIFIIRDLPDKKRDDLIASHILNVHRDKTMTVTEISADFLKKYIAYAKKNIIPILTKEAIEKIKEFYVNLRNAAGEEEGIKPVPITARQLEAIVRLAEAYAKIKLDKKVRLEYAEKAIEMQMYCLEKIGLDPKTGQLDIDKITTGVTQSQRNEYTLVQRIIDNLEVNNPDITIDDLTKEGAKHGLKENDIKSILSKLKQEGIIFEPRKGVYKKLP